MKPTIPTNKNEETYLNLMKTVRTEGDDVSNRTGTGTRKIFGMQSRYDLRAGFPLLTTRKLNIKTSLSEMLWMIEGSGDERRLAELRYGKPRSELVGKNTVWTENLNASYWADKATEEGDLGRVYGVQVRDWRGPDGAAHDQLERVVYSLKNDADSRRHLVLLWNPAELDQMCLPPCHMLWHFSVTNGRLDMLLYMRSNDLFLGSPANLSEYALLIHMMAQVCGLTAGYLIYTIGDAHIYSNHFDAVDEQLSRTPMAAPKLIIDPTVKRMEDFTMDSFVLEGYEAHPVIKAPMAV